MPFIPNHGPECELKHKITLALCAALAGLLVLAMLTTTANAAPDESIAKQFAERALTDYIDAVTPALRAAVGDAYPSPTERDAALNDMVLAGFIGGATRACRKASILSNSAPPEYLLDIVGAYYRGKMSGAATPRQSTLDIMQGCVLHMIFAVRADGATDSEVSGLIDTMRKEMTRALGAMFR